jgi:RimJ/RimL family protein N-acetyltransferase
MESLATASQLVRLFEDDRVWQGITDDYCADMDRVEAATNMARLSVCLTHDPEVVFVLFVRGPTIADVHVIVGEEARGKRAVDAARKAMDEVFTHTTLEKITSMAPADNKGLRIFARACGFRKEGVLTKSIRRGGVLRDQIIYTMEKERFYGSGNSNCS